MFMFGILVLIIIKIDKLTHCAAWFFHAPALVRKIQIAGHNGPSKARCMGRKKRKREKKEEN